MLIADVKNKYVRMIHRSETRGISLKTSTNIFFPKCICFEHIFPGKLKENKIFFAEKTESPWLLSSLIQRCLFQADFFLDLCVIMWRADHPALKGIICSRPEVSYGSASGPERQLNLIAANRFPLATWTDPTVFPVSGFTAGPPEVFLF